MRNFAPPSPWAKQMPPIFLILLRIISVFFVDRFCCSRKKLYPFLIDHAKPANGRLILLFLMFQKEQLLRNVQILLPQEKKREISLSKTREIPCVALVVGGHSRKYGCWEFHEKTTRWQEVAHFLYQPLFEETNRLIRRQKRYPKWNVPLLRTRHFW